MKLESYSKQTIHSVIQTLEARQQQYDDENKEDVLFLTEDMIKARMEKKEMAEIYGMLADIVKEHLEKKRK